MGVVVKETLDANRYELHEIIDQDGNRIYIKKTQETPDFQDRSVSNNAFTGEPTVLSNDNVAQPETEINTPSEENTVVKPKV